jgi:hypothetical protein
MDTTITSAGADLWWSLQTPAEKLKLANDHFTTDDYINLSPEQVEEMYVFLYSETAMQWWLTEVANGHTFGYILNKYFLGFRGRVTDDMVLHAFICETVKKINPREIAIASARESKMLVPIPERKWKKPEMIVMLPEQVTMTLPLAKKWWSDLSEQQRSALIANNNNGIPFNDETIVRAYNSHIKASDLVKSEADEEDVTALCDYFHQMFPNEDIEKAYTIAGLVYEFLKQKFTTSKRA